MNQFNSRKNTHRSHPQSFSQQRNRGSQTRDTNDANSRSLFVKNVEHEASDDELKGYFSFCGQVERVIKYKPGVYCVVFKSINSAKYALDQLNGREFRGMNIRIERYKKKESASTQTTSQSNFSHRIYLPASGAYSQTNQSTLPVGNSGTNQLPTVPYKSGPTKISRNRNVVNSGQPVVQVVVNINSGNQQKIQMTKTLIVVMLDEFGSMGSRISRMQEVMAGYNHFLKEQKRITGDVARLCLIKFNDRIKVVHSPTLIGGVPPLNSHNYNPSGNTALYDALGTGIKVAESNVHAGERVLCLVLTDGGENSSKKYSQNRIKEMIRTRKERGNWTFVYIGVNPGLLSQQLGIEANNVVAYNDSNPKNSFTTASLCLSNFRTGGQQTTQMFFNLNINQ